MCRFYSWTDEYVESLSVDTFIDYWKAITVIEARQRLVDININALPNVDKGDRTKYIKGLEKQAYPVRKSEGKKIDNKELAAILSRR